MNSDLNPTDGIIEEFTGFQDAHTDVRALAELIGFATRLNSSRSLDNLLLNFSRGLADIWPGAGVRLCAIDRDAGLLIPLESLGDDPIPLKGSLLGNAATDRQCLLIENLDEYGQDGVELFFADDVRFLVDVEEDAAAGNGGCSPQIGA